MKGAKKAFREISTDLRVTAMRVASGDTTVFTKTDRVLAIAIMTLTIVTFAFATCFAAPDLFGQIQSQFADFYKKLVALSSIVAATCIVGGFLWTMVSPGQKSSAVPIAWIKKVFFCYFLILILGGLFGIIEQVTNGQGY